MACRRESARNQKKKEMKRVRLSLSMASYVFASAFFSFIFRSLYSFSWLTDELCSPLNELNGAIAWKSNLAQLFFFYQLATISLWLYTIHTNAGMSIIFFLVSMKHRTKSMWGSFRFFFIANHFLRKWIDSLFFGFFWTKSLIKL